MLRLAEEDTASFHALHKQVVDLLGRVWIRSHRAVDRQIKDAPVGRAAKRATQKAEHLAGQRLKHDDSSQARSIGQCCCNYWNNYLGGQ